MTAKGLGPSPVCSTLARSGKVFLRIAMAAETLADGWESLSCMISASVSIASGVNFSHKARTPGSCLGRPPGLPLTPFGNGLPLPGIFWLFLCVLSQSFRRQQTLLSHQDCQQLVNCIRRRCRHVHRRAVDATLEFCISIVGAHRVEKGSPLMLSQSLEQLVAGSSKTIFSLFHLPLPSKIEWKNGGIFQGKAIRWRKRNQQNERVTSPTLMLQSLY